MKLEPYEQLDYKQRETITIGLEQGLRGFNHHLRTYSQSTRPQLPLPLCLAAL